MNINLLKEFILISPRDIKEGEQFSLAELFSTENILQKYEEITNEIASRQVNELFGEFKKKQLEENKFLLVKQENIIQEKLAMLTEVSAQEKKELYKTMDEERKRNQKELEKYLSIEKELIRKGLDIVKNELKNEREKSKTYQNLLEENKNLFNNISEIYTKNLKDELIKNQHTLQEEHKRDIVKLTKEYESKTKSSNLIGENAEREIKDKLKFYFPSDRIITPSASIGEADVLHRILEQDKEIATIYYEIKKRKNWNKANYDNFADKVRKEKHTFNIFISSSLPKKSPEQHIKIFEGSDFLYDEINNIYITTFENWLPVIASLRNNAISINKLENFSKNKHSIQEEVYSFFKSSEFQNYFSRIQSNIKNSKNYIKNIQQNSIKVMSESDKIWFELENLNAQLNIKFSGKK